MSGIGSCFMRRAGTARGFFANRHMPEWHRQARAHGMQAEGRRGQQIDPLPSWSVP